MLLSLHLSMKLKKTAGQQVQKQHLLWQPSCDSMHLALPSHRDSCSQGNAATRMAQNTCPPTETKKNLSFKMHIFDNEDNFLNYFIQREPLACNNSSLQQ